MEETKPAIQARRAYRREYYATHRQAILDYRRKYYAADPKRQQEYNRKYWERKGNQKSAADSEPPRQLFL